MQLWTIKGQTYTHAQLMELRKQGLDPRKDNIEMKFITKNKQGEIVGKKEEDKKMEEYEKELKKNQEQAKKIQEALENETEEQEFERLKQERAWKNENKKARYAELKAKLNK